MDSSNSASGVVNGLVGGARHALTADRGWVDTAIRSVANPLEPHRSLSEMDNSPAGNLFGAAIGVTGAAALAHKYAGDMMPPPPAQDTAVTAAAQPPAGNNPATPAGGAGQPPAKDPRTTTDQAALDKGLAEQGKLTAHNTALASQVQRAMSGLSANPSFQEISDALAMASASADEAELKAAVASLNMDEFSPDVAQYLRQFI